MPTTVYKLAKLYCKMFTRTGDGRKEHDPAHVHIIYQGNNYAFEITKTKHLSDSDFRKISGQLTEEMKELAQFLLDNYQQDMLKMWETENVYRIQD